jgi:formylmethanofuran dehydrogenase subunit C
VSFNGNVACHAGSPYADYITIGSGGLSVTGDVKTQRGNFTASGNVTVTGRLRSWDGSLVQNGGT